LWIDAQQFATADVDDVRGAVRSDLHRAREVAFRQGRRCPPRAVRSDGVDRGAVRLELPGREVQSPVRADGDGVDIGLFVDDCRRGTRAVDADDPPRTVGPGRVCDVVDVPGTVDGDIAEDGRVVRRDLDSATLPGRQNRRIR
jgi:hypothetical protein